MFYISFSLHILPTFIGRRGSFLVSNSYPELVGVGMLPYLIIYREKEKEKIFRLNVINFPIRRYLFREQVTERGKLILKTCPF